MNNQSKQKHQPPLRGRGRALPRHEGVRLNWAQLGHLTLGQAEQILREGSSYTHEGFLQLFVTLAGLASAETARSFSLIADEVRGRAADEGSTPDWAPFFAALRRERTTRAITEETTLRALSELLWEIHTAQDPVVAPHPGTSEMSRSETEA
jgi:hypothetical protein